MIRWAVLDLTAPGAPPVYVGRSRIYARYLAWWLAPEVAVIPWQPEHD